MSQTQDTLSIVPEIEPHEPDLYDVDGTLDGVVGLENVDEAAIARYLADGALVVRQAYTQQQVAAALRGVLDLIAGRSDTYRGVSYEASARNATALPDGDARQDFVRKLMGFVQHDQRLFATAHDPRLLGVLERILGDRPRLMQDMALLKQPGGREKPWHQDHAYFPFDPSQRIVGVWIALDEATLANGCMRVRPGEHRNGPLYHFSIRDWQICDRDMRGRKSIGVPLKPGDLLLFDSQIPHGTPMNTTNQRRRALQFHYVGELAQRVEPETHRKWFGGDVNNVEC